MSTKSRELYGIYFWGHGGYRKVTVKEAPKWDLLRVFEKTERIWDGLLTDADQMGDPDYYTYYGAWTLEYKLGFGVLWACGTEAEQEGRFASDKFFRGSPGVLVPWGFHMFGDRIKKVLSNGE